ncbi:hypothetical protein DL546_009308 [Coniochaeta pulveracea]|uniref:Uncharacterized protein n=1 Tax=Coniochaeta pulveracea TaxID=177199 RepID=A0A420YLB9_9PEZI|nr:hypothetical protein DL546_009308 [Coniochaeta pulveracea]
MTPTSEKSHLLTKAGRTKTSGKPCSVPPPGIGWKSRVLKVASWSTPHSKEVLQFSKISHSPHFRGHHIEVLVTWSVSPIQNETSRISELMLLTSNISWSWCFAQVGVAFGPMAKDQPIRTCRLILVRTCSRSIPVRHLPKLQQPGTLEGFHALQ